MKRSSKNWDCCREKKRKGNRNREKNIERDEKLMLRWEQAINVNHDKSV